MNLKLIFGSLAVVLLLSSSTTAQLNDSDCLAAQKWHLQQAMKLSLVNNQDYHLGAAEAARQLSLMSNSPCAGWRGWVEGKEAWTAP